MGSTLVLALPTKPLPPGSSLGVVMFYFPCVGALPACVSVHPVRLGCDLISKHSRAGVLVRGFGPSG